jgi:dinuclear metal center YbgI/SA1388 family protein
MTVREIQDLIESWAPRQLAWERDNVGLQVGSPDNPVHGILVALDVTDRIIDEALRRRANLIVSHHPLLFHPVRSITGHDRVGRLIQRLVQSEIAVYSAHTNLDFATTGVSMELADRLGLQDVDVLSHAEQMLKKVVVFVPTDHVNAVMTAMAGAGGGTIGKYDQCTFQSVGTGTFRPSGQARPYIGQKGTLERVSEVRLEMVVPMPKLPSVLLAMRSAHPYEEIAFDVYALDNASPNQGAGAIGRLKRPLTLQEFLKQISRTLSIGALRYSGNPRTRIRSAAVCGGSGSDLISTAIGRHADAFVTADVKYHAFQEADGRIALIDAGHFETERPIVQRVAHYLQSNIALTSARIRVFSSTVMDNPVRYYAS